MFPLQIPSVRYLQSNIKVTRTNEFLNNLREDSPIEEEPENDSLFNLEDDVSTFSSNNINNNNNDTFPQTKDNSNNNNDSLIEIEDKPEMMTFLI